MADSARIKPIEGLAPEAGGYRQELKRTLGQGQVFAISFAFISVAVGVFGTYDDVLQTAGPVGIWLWVIAAIGQTLVALVIAQFSARIALTGSSYQWASRLANPRIGWGFGWMSVCYLGISVPTIDNALASQALMPLLSMAPDENTARTITLVVLLIQTALAIASTRIVGMLNALAVGVEISIVSVLVIALVIAFSTTGLGSISNLTSRGITTGDVNYFGIGGGLMLAMLMGLTTLTGFDAAANLAEEAKDPYRSVPRAIVGSVVAAGVLGLLLLIALTVAIPNIEKISRSGEAVAQILNNQLGPLVERMLLVAICFAFFACGMVVLATASRLIYAMSRDGRFPFHRVMRQVNARTQTPIPATLLIFAGGVVLMIVMPGKALLVLITAGTILPVLIYAATVVLYLAVRRKLDRKEGAFDLGRLELPIAISALVWLLAAIFVLVTPRAALVPVFVVVGMVVIGGLYFIGMLLFDHKSLDTEPETIATSMH